MSLLDLPPVPVFHPAQGLYVVETEDGQAYLGRVTVDRQRGSLTIWTGLAGRPAVLALDDVEEIHNASDYPGVVVQAAGSADRA